MNTANKRKAARVRAKKLSPSRRKEIARAAINARWDAVRKARKNAVIVPDGRNTG